MDPEHVAEMKVMMNRTLTEVGYPCGSPIFLVGFPSAAANVTHSADAWF